MISLSDLLTPWDVIEKRLRAAAYGDFAVALYNPSSRKRADYLRRACEILLEQKSPDTICGIARNIGREECSINVLTLSELRDTPVDMILHRDLSGAVLRGTSMVKWLRRGDTKMSEVLIFGGTTEGRLPRGILCD